MLSFQNIKLFQNIREIYYIKTGTAKQTKKTQTGGDLHIKEQKRNETNNFRLTRVTDGGIIEFVAKDVGIVTNPQLCSKSVGSMLGPKTGFPPARE
jgi:hypothetical protein